MAQSPESQFDPSAWQCPKIKFGQGVRVENLV